MCNYNSFVNDYNNPNLTAHDVRRINKLNGKQYSRIRAIALTKGDIPKVRHMNTTGAKFYTRTSNGQYQVQKTINGKKTIIGRFKDRDTAEEIVNACINHNWQINEIKGLIDLLEVKPKNYSRVGDCWVVQKSINSKNVVFNSFNINLINETKVLEIVDFYRNHNWDIGLKNYVKHKILNGEQL